MSDKVVSVEATLDEWRVVRDALEYVLGEFRYRKGYEEDVAYLRNFLNVRFNVWCKTCGFIQEGCVCEEEDL